MEPQYEFKSFTKCYTLPQLTSLQVINNIGIQLDKDADFFWEATLCQYTALDIAILPFAVQFIDQTEYALSQTWVPGCVYMAASQGLAPVRLTMPVHWFPAGSAIIMNAQNLSDTANGPIQFLFRGVKRYVKNNEPQLGMGDLVDAGFPVPQNPIRQGMGALVDGCFPVPMNPIMRGSR